MREYLELLAIPNVASDRRTSVATPTYRRDVARRSLSPRLLKAKRRGTATDYGEWRVPAAKRTYILYAHYDGQPVTAADWRVTRPSSRGC